MTDPVNQAEFDSLTPSQAFTRRNLAQLGGHARRHQVPEACSRVLQAALLELQAGWPHFRQLS